MYANPSDRFPYCHVGGIKLSEHVELAAVADISCDMQAAFRGRWGGCFPKLNYYDSAGEMLRRERLDIVAVCVKGPFHFQVLMEVIAGGPRAIFLEKPPTCSLAEMDQVVNTWK